MTLILRNEETSDRQAIEEVTRAAFLNAPHAAHTEHLIVNGLREAGALSISLVAEQEGKVVGHVAVSPVDIGDGAAGWYGLGPLSVLPELQGQGIGSALMRKAIEKLKSMGAAGCVLVGNPVFYNRFGFRAEPGLTYPNVPVEYLLSLPLNGEIPQGEVTYHPAFSLD